MLATCNGLEIAFDDRGSGSAILFIHGHPFNRTMWQPQVEKFSSRYRVIAPDLRGYGESERGSEAATTLEMFASDGAALLDTLDVAKACVVGLSMGGQIAMEFARAYPERTAGLVLAATFARAETADGVKVRNDTADRLIAEGMAAPGCEMLPMLLGKSSMKRMPALAASVYQMIVSTDPLGAASALRGRALRRDYSDALATLEVPALVIVGTEDAYTTMEEAAEMQQRIPNGRLMIFDGIGHMPNLEDPSRFNAALETFLKALDVTRRS